MLSYINIKNFAVIKELELDLQPGMTVLTGETGAGKSIIIDTLEFALGGKAGSGKDQIQLIRNGADKCEITIMFDLTGNPIAKQWLIDQELDSEDECIIRRTISKDGRSKCSINGHTCNQQLIRTLSDFLIDIHGQHEHQLLLKSDRQRELLDAYAECKELSAKTKQIYFTWLKAKKTLIDMQAINDNSATKLEFITHQLKEFAHINLDISALEKLRAEQHQLSNAEELISTTNAALNLLTENENGAILPGLFNVKYLLEKNLKFDNKLKNSIELIQNAIIHTEEASKELQREMTAIELNQDRLNEVEAQLTTIYDLARKHHVKPEELPSVKHNLEEQLLKLQNSTHELQKLEEEIKVLEKEYLAIATKLTKAREIAATKLNQLITNRMHTLGMKGSAFFLQLEPNYKQSFSSGGLEHIEFLVSTNPGQPFQSITKIASGGELSRISLAIQVEIAEKEVTPTLIFDEIDSGVGGKTAEIVGQSLRKLGKTTQVLCVTHLPQVATQGHHHLLVTKEINAKETEINITNLSKKERIEEIARMLGGINITKQTIAHATEMLNAVI